MVVKHSTKVWGASKEVVIT
jgi:hypothetical protein